MTPTQTELPRLVLVSDWPPVREGVAVSSCIVLERLFRAYPAERIAYAALASAPSWLALPPGVKPRLYRIPAFPDNCLPCRRASVMVNLCLHAFFVRQLMRQCRTVQPEVIFAVPTVFGHLLRAALVVGQRLHIPVAALFLDDWRETYRRSAPWLAGRAACWQRHAMETVNRLYVNGPGMKRHYETEYAISGTVLWSPVDVEAFARAAAAATPRQPDAFVITYTGTIYDAQKDALDNLVAALKLLNQEGAPRVFLDLYTDLSESTLRKWGWLRHDVRLRKPVPSQDIPAVLTSADLLFLPLSFSPRLAFTVQTAAPGKLPEYAASGRPVLVHAPAYADVTRLSRERGLDLIVDQPDPRQLAAAVNRIRQDPVLAQDLGVRGRAVVREYYDRETVQRNLYAELAVLSAQRTGSVDCR